MPTVRELHDRAMTLADDMMAARRRADAHDADRLAVEAFDAELGAATLAFDLDVSHATRLILLRSAANLGREARRGMAPIDDR
jgi:hypothetical protein